LPEAPENTALAELLAAIADRRIRRKVQKLLQLGEAAVRALGELDAALYVREGGEDQLSIVSDAVLSHFRRLVEYLGMVANPDEAVPGAVDGEASSRYSAPNLADAARTSGRISVPNLSAEAARTSGRISVTNLGAEPPARGSARSILLARSKTDDEKWRSLAGEMDTFKFGLSSELREYDRRFADALSNERNEQALVDLNDATTALMDGAFAVMETVYECFLGHAEPERMIPGHRDTLGKALAIRRAIATLRGTVRTLNASIQDRASPPPAAQSSYQQLIAAIDAFIEGVEFTYLRSDTRKDFHRFREHLAAGNASRNRLDCEGFDKYLDSLAFVSQRGVLIKHDTDLKARISAELERALAYAKVLPDLVCEVIVEAFVLAERLLGLNDPIDAIVERWFALGDDGRSDPAEVIPLARALSDLVRPLPTAASAGDDDFL
jgi:hypothetical protein